MNTGEETCQYCHQIIKRQEQAYVVDGKIACARCDKKNRLVPVPNGSFSQRLGQMMTTSLDILWPIMIRSLEILTRPAVTCCWPENEGEPKQFFHIPWSVFLVLSLLPLWIRLPDDPHADIHKFIGPLCLAGISIGLFMMTVFGVGHEGRILSDLLKLMLPLTFLVSSSLPLFLGTPALNEAIAQRERLEAAREAHAHRINAELARFPWSSITRSILPEGWQITKMLWVDARTHRLSPWHRSGASFEAQSLDECDLIVLIREQWEDSDMNWITYYQGAETKRRPVKRRVWHVSLLSPKLKAIFEEHDFYGEIHPNDFVNWPLPNRTNEDITKWEDTHCSVPSGELMRWIQSYISMR